MRNVGRVTGLERASVTTDTRAIHSTRIVDAEENAKATKTAQTILLVLETNVLIHALEHAAHTQYVPFKNIFLCVLVQRDIPGIHSFHAEKNRLHLLHVLILACLHHVVQTHSAERLIVKLFAPVCPIT